MRLAKAIVLRNNGRAIECHESSPIPPRPNHEEARRSPPVRRGPWRPRRGRSKNRPKEPVRMEAKTFFQPLCQETKRRSRRPHHRNSLASAGRERVERLRP